jgi:Family of unknown function (DUF6232)
MDDQVLFDSNDVVVTSSKLVYAGSYYPLHTIKSVVFFKEPLDVKGLVINIVVALAGLLGVFTFKTFCLIAGLIGVAVGGFNLYNFYNDIANPTYVVAVDFHSGEPIYIKRRDMAWAKRLHDTLHDAMMS